VQIDPGTHVGSVSLRVADADRVAQLYEGAVGLKRIEGPRGVALSADGEHPLLVLNESPGAPPPPHRAAGLFHTALLFSTRPALADALRRVVEAGFRLTGASDHGVSEALYLDDPEGNGVELYWDRPREEWPMRPDGGIDMFTAPLDVRALLAEAQGAPDDPAAMVGHAHLKVTDIPRSVAFWRDALGLDLKAMYGDQAAFLAAGDYHHHIGANIWQSAGGPPAPEDALGLERVTLALPDQAALLAAVEQLREHGDVQQADGAALVRDPDGILVELRA
jgi:catechol 2,3-dioxygenase